jgi:accessory gene regulator protein AgrB
MYSWIWRHLHGGTASKTVLSLILVAAVVALLLFVVFPWVEPYLPFNDVTVDG